MTEKVTALRRAKEIAADSPPTVLKAPPRPAPDDLTISAPKPRKSGWPPRLAHPERLIAAGALSREPESSEIGSGLVAVGGQRSRLGGWIWIAIILAAALIIFGVRR